MALGIFIAGIVLVVIALAADYFRAKHHRVSSEEALLASGSKINELQDRASHLQDEVEDLRSKLQNTFVDPVTKLLGWQLFEDRVQQALKDCERHHFAMGLAMVDIDSFKTINDAMGYEFGDAILLEVASRLNECLREVDNVSRFAKDTFVVMLSQLTKPETAAIVGQRILQSLALPFQVGNEEIHLTACVGIALYPADAATYQGLLAHADHALHQAKTLGTQICQFYEEKMQLKSMRDLQLAIGVSKEEHYHCYSLLFQPIYNKERQMAMLEVSVKWIHPELGQVTHDELFHAAEKQRKLNALSQWLVRQACKQFIQFQKQDPSCELLVVPVSMKQLENPHFVYEISQIMQQLHFKPEWLLIELRQHGASASYDILEKAFNMLHYLGVKIAVDHFGADTLSFRYLNAMKINYLKLDPSFINDVTENRETLTLLKAIYHFAQILKMAVIVTGIENAAQVQLLQSLGYELMQGAYLCEALPEAELQLATPEV